jgi:predicted RND superfamily exporter protein
MSMPQMMKVVSGGWNEGNLKWRTLPISRGETEEEQARIRSLLTQASRPIETATGLLNADCSAMPVYIFLTDHKAETIDTITGSIKEWIAANPFPAREGVDVKLRLATGYIGVMAATNDAVRDAQWPMLLAVYIAVATFCLIAFRSIIAVLCCLLPLVVVGLLANALMAKLGIGLKVATLPVAALGVGIGVDYAIYIYSRLQVHLQQGHALTEAWLKSLRETGSAVLFTGLTLAAGVSTWIFSALKFQADMGLLLTFMFLVNMLAAVILLPALAALFIRSSGR